MRILMTGAAGNIGARLRTLLKPIYPELILSDMRAPADLGANDRFITADLTELNEMRAALEGMDGVIHLGGHSVEGPWETILNANIIGTYNLYEAARQAGVKRIVFASSNHAVGFYPRAQTIGANIPPLPDSRYGVSKAFGESLAALYAYKHGIGTLAIRIGNVADQPVDARRLAIWQKPEDLVQLVRIGLERPGLLFEIVYGVSDNARRWYDNGNAEALGYRAEGRSEDFAEAVLASEPRNPNPVSEHFQGGGFCAQEFDADFERLKALI